MEKKVIEVEIPEGIDLKRTLEVVSKGLFLYEDVTTVEYSLVISILEDLTRDTEKRIAIFWSEEDVRSVAETLDVNLRDDQVHHLLERLKIEHDADIGITWDVIESYVDLYSLPNIKNTEE